MNLSKFKRISLGHLMTPLEFMPRLTAKLNGPSIYIKRDDCTGLATGGNKTRKLEFLMADAIAKNADTIITVGAIQSNHARQTAAAAARLGLKCELLLEDRTGHRSLGYTRSGNVLLSNLLGATIHRYPKDADIDAALQEVSDAVRTRGGRPYVIPTGGSNSIGTLGYVECARELIAQADKQQIRIDHVVHATGSSGTQAGLIVGFEATHNAINVLGIGVRSAREVQERNVFALACETADLLESAPIPRGRVVANCDYVGAGYGQTTNGMVEAVALVAACEGILLDPVYSGKAMAGLIDLIRSEEFKKDQNIVFLHTGGSAALFGYEEILADASEKLVEMQ